MRAAVYARVSTERQGRDQTIESQLDALRGWAADHGHELKREHVYIDEGYSGSRIDRPALDRLRDAAREGELDVVGVYGVAAATVRKPTVAYSTQCNPSGSRSGQ
jgi:site-specific DNA recombinase